MSNQPAEVTSDHDEQQTRVPCIEDSEEESIVEEMPVTPWNELSIIERVGLSSCDMSEEEVESAFHQISLAFRCDQYTLKQRLQAEEHARNMAEENIELELTRGRETLETLKALCLDSKRSKIVQRLELCLEILCGTVERVSNTAEILGAVHQEARVSRAVELMITHVENVKRRHERDIVELEEIRKLKKTSNRTPIEPSKDIPDDGECEIMLSVQNNTLENNGRRRVSVSLLSKQTLEKRRKEKILKKQTSLGDLSSKQTTRSHPPEGATWQFKRSVEAKEENRTHLLDDRPTAGPDPLQSGAAAVHLPDQSIHSKSECPTHQTTGVATKKIQNNSSSLFDTLRHRQKGKAVNSKKKGEKEKKNTLICKRFPLVTCYSTCGQHPLAHWLYHSRWLIFIYLLVLCCVFTLTFFLWS